MKKYLVEITETLQKQITVSANSREEAEQKVKERYRNEDIVLTEDDYIDTDFHVIKEILNERQNPLNDVPILNDKEHDDLVHKLMASTKNK